MHDEEDRDLDDDDMDLLKASPLAVQPGASCHLLQWFRQSAYLPST